MAMVYICMSPGLWQQQMWAWRQSSIRNLYYLIHCTIVLTWRQREQIWGLQVGALQVYMLWMKPHLGLVSYFLLTFIIWFASNVRVSAIVNMYKHATLEYIYFLQSILHLYCHNPSDIHIHTIAMQHVLLTVIVIF